MLTLEEIKKYLSDRNYTVVAEATGISYNTIRVIARDESANPTYKVMEKLSNYFEGNE